MVNAGGTRGRVGHVTVVTQAPDSNAVAGAFTKGAIVRQSPSALRAAVVEPTLFSVGGSNR